MGSSPKTSPHFVTVIVILEIWCYHWPIFTSKTNLLFLASSLQIVFFLCNQIQNHRIAWEFDFFSLVRVFIYILEHFERVQGRVGRTKVFFTLIVNLWIWMEWNAEVQNLHEIDSNGDELTLCYLSFVWISCVSTYISFSPLFKMIFKS